MFKKGNVSHASWKFEVIMKQFVQMLSAQDLKMQELVLLAGFMISSMLAPKNAKGNFQFVME